MPLDVDAMAAEVVLLVKTALGPVLERLAAAEARLAVVGDVRDRLVAVETKAAQPVVVGPSPADQELAIVNRVEPLTKQLAALSERIVAVETRPLVPGPAGKDGADGQNGEPGPSGKDGVDGKDGAPGLSFEGVYQDGKSYELGHLVTWAGSSWHCNEPTTTKPGDGSKAWTLMVKRGRDGKDGLDASGALPVVRTR